MQTQSLEPGTNPPHVFLHSAFTAVAQVLQNNRLQVVTTTAAATILIKVDQLVPSSLLDHSSLMQQGKQKASMPYCYGMSAKHSITVGRASQHDSRKTTCITPQRLLLPENTKDQIDSRLKCD